MKTKKLLLPLLILTLIVSFLATPIEGKAAIKYTKITTTNEGTPKYCFWPKWEDTGNYTGYQHISKKDVKEDSDSYYVKAYVSKLYTVSKKTVDKAKVGDKINVSGKKCTVLSKDDDRVRVDVKGYPSSHIRAYWRGWLIKSRHRNYYVAVLFC